MEPYALEDVILTRKISDVYEQTLINKPDLRQVYEFERKAMDALFAIEKRGLPARQHEYRKLEQEVITNLDHLESKVMQLAEMADVEVYNKELERPAGSAFDFNPNSTPQILAALKARGADMSYMSQDKGTVSADADNLRAVDDELAAAILEFRSEYKLLSTYVRPMIGRSYVSAMNTYKEPFIAPDSRIHATYRQVGARTGRMSCADPNMQNQPRDDLRLRYNIVADEGYKLVAVDLSNIEMVLFAAYCGEGRLLKAVQNGEDLHVLTAKMLGLRDRKRPGGGIETARQLGKTYNFSRVYGGGLRTIRRQFRCSMDEARLLKKRFDDAYPEVSRLQARIQYRLEDDGYIQDKLISGRRFRVDPRDAYKATNYLVQGTAAALLKYAVIKLHEDGVPMVALVHDEIVAHVPERDAQEAANLIEARMTEFEGLKGIVPLRAEADIVERWSDAKPLKDDDGKPYLFTPKWAGGEKRYLPEAA
jgi:DNA polymerase-1